MGPTRRSVLAAAGTGLSGALAGCQVGGQVHSCTPLGSQRAPPVDRGDLSLPVPESELLKATTPDDIRAIVEPAFARGWSGIETSTSGGLVENELVVGVERDGRARAYPLQVLWDHEVVNDDLGGPLLVSFCPICGSSVTAVRTVGGEPTTFGVSGYLWRADLVMYDELTDSLWSQILATAIRGTATGETLALVPSTLTTWASWRSSHPETDVLLPPPRSGTLGRALQRPYYFPYDREQLFSERDVATRGEHAAVLGVVVDDRARAYPHSVLRRERVVNDRLAGHPLLVALGPGDRMYAYDRCVDGRPLTFAEAAPGVVSGGGTRWRLATGRGLDGPFEGRQLRPAGGLPPMFLFAWVAFYPETDLYGADLDDVELTPK